MQSVGAGAEGAGAGGQRSRGDLSASENPYYMTSLTYPEDLI